MNVPIMPTSVLMVDPSLKVTSCCGMRMLVSMVCLSRSVDNTRPVMRMCEHAMPVIGVGVVGTPSVVKMVCGVGMLLLLSVINILYATK